MSIGSNLPASASTSARAGVSNASAVNKKLVLAQLDGVSFADLERARSLHLMPNLDAAIRSGRMTAAAATCTIPSQTVVSQWDVLAGGVNKDNATARGGDSLPANQWIDKRNDFRLVDPMGLSGADAVEAEAMQLGDGGLLQGGRTYQSPLAAGADPKNTFFVLSTLAAASHKGQQATLPAGVTRTIARVIPKVSQQQVEATVSKLGGIASALKTAAPEFFHVTRCIIRHPQQIPVSIANTARVFKREYDFTRRTEPQTTPFKAAKSVAGSAFIHGYLTDASTRSMQEDMRHGVDSMYIDYDTKDHENHESNVQDFALAGLQQVDLNLGILFKAAKKWDYNVVIYADHGSCEGVKFADKFGETFPQFLNSIVPANHAQSMTRKDGSALPPFLTQDIGSGCNIYFTSTTDQMDGSQVEAGYPGMLDAIMKQPGTAFVMTREGSATVLQTPEGKMVVDGGKVTTTGVSPLAQFNEGDEMALQLADMCHRRNQGDIMVMGKQEGGQMLNYGSAPGLHGGIGIGQQSPMIAFDSELPIDPSAIHSGRDLHQQLVAIAPPALQEKLAARAAENNLAVAV